MRGETTAAALAARLLWGLDEAMAGRPRALPLALRGRAARAAGGLIEYVRGFPCLCITPFAFYSEKTAALLQALDRCCRSGKVDEIECCLRHALEPGRSLVLDWLL